MSKVDEILDEVIEEYCSRGMLIKSMMGGTVFESREKAKAQLLTEMERCMPPLGSHPYPIPSRDDVIEECMTNIRALFSDDKDVHAD